MVGDKHDKPEMTRPKHATQRVPIPNRDSRRSRRASVPVREDLPAEPGSLRRLHAAYVT